MTNNIKPREFWISNGSVKYRKDMTKEFGSKYLKVREVLSSSPDWQTIATSLAEALENSSVRLNAIKNNTDCIGLNNVHVDFNCIHCLAEYSVSKNKEALEAFEKASGK